jgi:hypothetical protein
MRLQFGLEAYQHRSKPVAAQRLVNCWLEKSPVGAKNPVALIGSYGIADFTTAGTGYLRGGLVVKNVACVVSGTGLYRISSGGTATLLGTVPNLDRVSMAGDGTNIMIVTGGDGYVWNGTTVAQITDPDFPGADWVVYLDGYFVIGINGEVYISDPFDPTAWNALEFASAEASPDDIVGAIVEKRELFIGGQDTIEVWMNTGNADFPLERIPSGVCEIGLLSRFGFAKADNSVFFPATDFTVRRMDGYTPVIISTPVISQAIEDLADKTMYGMTWTEGGHTMYGLTSSEWTKVFDTSSQLWHDRKSYGYEYSRPMFALNTYNKWLMGDALSNKIGQLSADTFTEWGDPLVMLGSAYVSAQDNAQITSGRLELAFEQGVGLATGQGSDPQVMMRQSFDDARKWTSEAWRDMGRIGETTKTAVWNRCGKVQHPVSRTLEFSISDPVRRALIYATYGPREGE